MRLGFVKSIFQKVDTLFTGRGRIDDDLLDDLEAALLQADVNVHTTVQALDHLREAVRENRLKDADEVRTQLRSELAQVLTRTGTASRELAHSSQSPTVFLVVGVNGVGKTTSIAKIAAHLKRSGHSVLLAAADTFRAAAIDQLVIWGDRIGVEVTRHKEGADPSAVVFDAIQAARKRGTEYVVIDTAGRIHTRANLMEELKKIERVTEREIHRKPDETLLVLDATTGQNGVAQARAFGEAIGLTGLVLAKLDGTARGGIVITIADELGLPIKLVGTGEGCNDLEPFDPDAFVEALLS